MQLKPEKNNEVDPSAIEIYFRNIKIGYVPQKYSGIITGILDSESKLYAHLIEFDESKPTWERVLVAISMSKKE